MNEEMVTCPFFKEHTMPRQKLIWHTVRCKAKVRKPGLLYCPFNPVHRLSAIEYEDHVSACPQKPDYDLAEFIANVKGALEEQRKLLEPKAQPAAESSPQPETSAPTNGASLEVPKTASLEVPKTAIVEERKLDEKYILRRRGKAAKSEEDCEPQ